MQMQEAPRPVCFVAMPFGKKAPPGQAEPLIDFDSVLEHIHQTVTELGLECVRADYELSGGFIHESMCERLLLAECVIADLTFFNPNVAYEVGVRQGAGTLPTILIGADSFLQERPFDFAPLRVFSYSVGRDGSLSSRSIENFRAGLRRRLHAAISGDLPVDYPILQLTSSNQSQRLEHEKTDVYLSRKRLSGQIGREIEAALNKADDAKAIESLAQIENRVLKESNAVSQLHSILMAIYLEYRERRAYLRMVDLCARFPAELRRTAVVQEQLALALNRLAEQAEREAADCEGPERETSAKELRNQAHEFRKQALATLDGLRPELATSETWGIRGRIHKACYNAELTHGNRNRAKASLGQAISAYWAGVKADMRDYYLGVNCLTLSLLRALPEDFDRLEALLPVVRQAVEFAPQAESLEERYWSAATRLEIASAAKDYPSARKHLLECLQVGVSSWMRQTTADNLRIHLRAFEGNPEAVHAIEELIDGLLAD